MKEKMKSKSIKEIVYGYKDVRTDWKNFWSGLDRKGEQLSDHGDTKFEKALRECPRSLVKILLKRTKELSCIWQKSLK